ncbi:MAG: GntR family transcriptional regulator [Actinomycetota bacterium]
MVEAGRALIGSEPLSTSIKRILLDRIVKGELVPGERIVESRLAKELEISQSPVREALRDLAAIGLVDIESRRGARVRQPTATELCDVSEVRSEIDALAARLAANRLDEDTLDELRQAHQQMIECHQDGDYVAMTAADAEFHRIIAHASGNQTVERVFGQLEPFARTFITLTSPHVEVDGILSQPGGILDALVARDPELASQRARDHQLSVRQAFFVEPAAAE